MSRHVFPAPRDPYEEAAAINLLVTEDLDRIARDREEGEDEDRADAWKKAKDRRECGDRFDAHCRRMRATPHPARNVTNHDGTQTCVICFDRHT